MSKTTRLIKKYKNRRLYDLEKSQYITIDDLRQDVMNGLDFQVVDSTSGADITHATLLQMFLEMGLNTTPFLSASILRQLIVLSNHPLSQSFKLMLEQMMLTIDAQRLQASDYFNPMDAWSKQTEDALQQWQAMFHLKVDK